MAVVLLVLIFFKFMPLHVYCNTNPQLLTSSIRFLWSFLHKRFVIIDMDERSYMQVVWNFEKHIFSFGWMKNVSVEEKCLRLKETLFLVIFQELWKYFDDLLIHFFLIISHFSYLAAPNLHVSPKTEIYLNFSIKNRGRNMQLLSFCIQFLQF